MQNLVDLCRPTTSKFKGLPFIPRAVKAVDLFPHTNHCEIIVELIRQEEWEWMMPETRLLNAEAPMKKVDDESKAENVTLTDIVQVKVEESTNDEGTKRQVEI